VVDEDGGANLILLRLRADELIVARALTRASSGHPRLADMSLVIKAVLSLAVAIGGVVAMASLASTLADVLGGIVALVATLVFTRAIMDFAAEPGEKPEGWGRPR
jgi:hypothetical protein